MPHKGVEVSVILPFSDHEETVGRLVRRIDVHLRGLGLSHEILAVDEDAGDNSVALLELLSRTGVPALKLLAAEPGRGHGVAIAQARGRIVWLVDPAQADAPLAPFARAADRLLGDLADVVVVDGRYLVARRARAWQVLERTRGRGERFERRLTRRALLAGLRVEQSGAATAVASPPRATRLRQAAPALAARAQLWGRVLSTYVR